MNYTIRQALPSDARGYINLIRSILREQPPVDTPYAPDEFDPPVQRIRDRIIEVNDSDNSVFLIAEASGRTIGALTCGGGSLKADRHMTALGIYVAKAWRDRGVGSALMKACVEWAQASPVVERVELEVFAGNARAIHVYEKFGFVHEGVKRRLYYQNGSPVDMAIMALLLERKQS